MLKKTSILSLVVLIVFMGACKKNSDTPSPTITGTWTLAGMNVIQATTIIGLPTDSTDSVKVIYTDNYPMSTVSGSFQFTSDSLYVNGLAYTAQPQLTLSEYSWPGMVLDSTATAPGSPVAQDSVNFSFLFASISNKDTISFPQGGIIYPAAGLPLPLTPKGASYTFIGDTLKLTMSADSTLPASVFGSSDISYFGANSQLVLKLVKKKS